MEEFDFFGTGSQNEESGGTPELDLSFELDYENLLTDGNEKNVKLCTSVKPSDDLRRSFEKNGGIRGAHICLVIDVSDSMYKVIDDTNSVRTGRTEVGEDGKTYSIVTGGIAKIHIAKNSAKTIVNKLGPNDTLSCIAYGHDVHIIFRNLKAADSEQILWHLDNIMNYKEYSTNISGALRQAGNLLTEYQDALPKRIIFFTDGNPTGEDTERKGVDAGKWLADNNITVESMGFGNEEVNFPYLQKISSASGGITTLIDYPDQFATVFASLFTQSQSVVVTNVRLVLELRKGTKISDYYRGTPDNVYLGNLCDSDSRTVEINFGQIEKNQMYKHYFNITLDGRTEYEGPASIIGAELHYSVPGKHNDQEQIIKSNVTVNWTSDEDEAAIINGNVSVLFRLAMVKRLDKEIENVYKKNQKETIRLIKEIIGIYTDLQKPVEAQAYRDMLNEYKEKNEISPVILNKATSSSSQAQETGILEDLDDNEMNKFSSRLSRRRRH